MQMPTDDDDDFEDDQAYDADDSDSEPTVPCPWCKREILEDCDRCPFCEQYLSIEDAPSFRKPSWIIAGTLVCLYIVYHWIFLGP